MSHNKKQDQIITAKVDYDNIYSTASDNYFGWVKKVCLWKAQKLKELLKNRPKESILEIGTGRGDVLEALDCFKKKIGADISEEALKQHKLLYPQHKLIKIDADNKLPLNDNSVDCVLLCDILEHVEKPVELLREASRVGKYILLKIPIEKALLFLLMSHVRKIKYGLSHPSGHIHCWSIKDLAEMFRRADITVNEGIFLPTPIEHLKKKGIIKILIFKLCCSLDKVFKTTFFTSTLLGGSYFAIGQKI